MNPHYSVKVKIGIAFILLVLVYLMLLNLPEDKAVFSFSNNLRPCFASEGTKIGNPREGYVQLTRGTGEFYVVIPQINLNADLYDTCVIEMESPVAYDQGSLLFLSPHNAKKEKTTLDFDTGKANHMNRLWINVRKHHDWHGVIRDVIFFPSTNSQSVNLKSIMFVRGNLATRLRAWWGDFTCYSDPLLGAVFGWPSPYFISDWFNPLVLPFFWILLLVAVILVICVYLFRLDVQFSRIPVGIFSCALFVAWAMLDLSNNVYYFKAMRRNANLYWGQSMEKKKGIVTGNQDFIGFMKFCDDSLPMDGQIFNYVSRDYSGSAEDALGATQVNFNLRTRVESLKMRAAGAIPKPFYVFYRYQSRDIKGIELEQGTVNRHFVLKTGDSVVQQIGIQHYLEDITQIAFKIENTEINPEEISVVVLADDGTSVIAMGEFLGTKNGEGLVSISSHIPYRKSTVFIRVENRGEKPIYIEGSQRDSYREGKCFFNGQEIEGDLAFRVDYDVKHLVLFRKYNDHAYIFTK